MINYIGVSGEFIYIAGRSSVWLERYLGVVEAARSSRVAPTMKIKGLQGFAAPLFFYFLPNIFFFNHLLKCLI